MLAPLAKFIDWSVLQVAAMLPSIRKCARGDSKLAEAIEFLNGPNFIPAGKRTALESRTRLRRPRPAVDGGKTGRHLA